MRTTPANSRKKILLFSTLSPYPFWAGSENYWFDFVRDEQVGGRFEFHAVLADSPVTREKAETLKKAGAKASFYKHFNVEFARRNIYKLGDRVLGRQVRTLPWYDRIKTEKCDLVWFCADSLGNLGELEYAVGICQERALPYWIILQHADEQYFFSSERDIDAVSKIVLSAKRFVFIAERNRRSLETAIGQRLENAFHSDNALSAAKITEAKAVCDDCPVGSSGAARFFNLGRFSAKDKGQHLLLEAFSGGKWKGRDWRMAFIGVDDFGRAYMDRLIRFYGLESERIEMTAHTTDVFTEIAKHDVLLMPSLAEGTPYAMIESMACGRPAMGTPVGGIPELVIQGETGWLARTMDVGDVADAIEEAWQDRGRWAEMGTSARKHIEANFTQERTHARLLEVLSADT